MSQYFDIGERTLWNPSMGASRLFRRQVALFEAELGVPSGIGPMGADECQIDPAAFKTFTDTALAWHLRTHHAVTTALSEGFVATLLVLAERAPVDVDWAAADELGPARGGRRDVQVQRAFGGPAQDLRVAHLKAQAAELSRAMPR